MEDKQKILDLREKFHWPLIGNQHIVNFLTKNILKNRLTHAYIFLGPENLGKTTVANHFARILLCHNREAENVSLPCNICSSCRQFNILPKNLSGFNNSGLITHGDYYLIKKSEDKKNISIEQIRAFIRSLGMSSFLNSYKIGIIKGAEDLSQEAANALLKTLEEPQKKVVIILIVANIDLLPQTIVSRSQVLNFHPVKFSIIYDYLVKEQKSQRSVARNLAHLSSGRPALAVKFFKDKDYLNDYLEKVNAFINFLSFDLNKRIKEVENLIGSDRAGQENVNLVLNIIEIWQNIIRDLILLNLGHIDLIQHDIVLEKIKDIKQKFNISRAIDLANALRTGKRYIKANVNPKLVLENIVINI